MGLGLSFGKNKTKTNSTSKVDKTEDTNQVQTGTQSQSTTGSSSTTQSQTNNQSGATTSEQIGSTSQNTTGQTSQSGASTLFSDQVLSGLEGYSTNALGNLWNQGAIDTSALNFDSQAFVNNGMAAATTRVNNQVENDMNGLFDAIGGTSGGNTMAALLASRLQGDAAANLAGTQAQLTGQANEITRQNLATEMASRGQEQSFVSQLFDALKGGSATTAQVGTSAEQTAGKTQQIGTGTETQTGTSTGTSNTVTQQDVLTALEQLLNGTTHTVGTENTKGTQKQSGGGFGLSL